MSLYGKSEFKTGVYSAVLNLRAGNLTSLRASGDPEGANLLNVDNELGFGCLCATRKDSPPARDSEGKLWSPLKLKSWQLVESREYASVVERSGSRVVLENSRSKHRIVYEFHESFFDISVQGELPDVDQCGLSFPMAFMDLRQADDTVSQLLPTTLHRTEERDLCYALLERREGPGVLFTALTPCAGWRLVYGERWPIRALQMFARFDSRFDKSVLDLGPVDFKVRVSFPKDLDDALAMVQLFTGLPLVDAPSFYAETGREIALRVKGPAVKAVAFAPDGSSQELNLETVSAGRFIVRLKLSQEGFWRVKALDENGRGGDAVLKAALPLLESLKRARAINQPSLGGNAEDSYWVQAFCAFRKLLPHDERMDGLLHSELVDIWMQGLPFSGAPLAPEKETSLENLKPRQVKSVVIPCFSDGFYLQAPCPIPHSDRGREFSPFHLFRWERVQDAFAMIQSLLYAARAFGNDLFYEHAIRVADAHIKDHVESSGRVQCLRDDNLPVDYTTVITPLVSLIELLREMESRKDARAAALRATCLKIADYLVARGLEFPTEGAPAHMRWTEDGSISCTALSLFYAFVWLERDERYLKRALEIMDYHRIWTFRSPDVRSDGASFRYWETMWENDGEGRAINAGHAWNIWQAEAFFYQGVLTMNPKALLASWSGYCANWAKFRSDGKTSACFTPDYIPQRPPRLELCHRYPEHVDESLSFYVWPRMQDNWLETSVVIAPEKAGYAKEFGPIALNGRLSKDQDGLLFESDAIAFSRLFVFGELPGGKLRVKRGKRELEIKRDASAEALSVLCV